MSIITNSKCLSYFSNKSSQQNPKLFSLYHSLFDNVQFNDIKKNLKYSIILLITHYY